MIQVINSSGETIQGLYRTKEGSLSVVDPSQLRRAQLEVARAKELNELKDEIQELKVMFNLILNKLKDD